MRVHTSNETFDKLKAGDQIQSISFLPNDPPGCECNGMVRDWNTKFGQMAPKEIKKAMARESIECPKAKEDGYKKYQIICAVCGDLMATVSAKDKDLNDWCNLHYIYEAKINTEDYEDVEVYTPKNSKKTRTRIVVKKREFGEWHGCQAVSISPMDGKIGFECACGNDTRDFRAKNNLTGAELVAKLKETMSGREFNKKDSKYILKEIK